MNAFALHDTSERAAALRWSSSAATIAALHMALIALGMAWTTQPPAPGVVLPAIMVDLAPVSSAPQSTPLDRAPGPVMEQADASPPEAAERQAAPEEQIAPTPPQEKPAVEAPPEQKMQPTPPKPEPTKVVPDQKPEPVKPKHTRADAKQPNEAPPAPRTTASPRAERQAPAASAVSAGGVSGGDCILQPARRRASAALPAIPTRSQSRRSPGRCASELQPWPQRSGACQPVG
jgi:periplasmic protein TonB